MVSLLSGIIYRYGGTDQWEWLPFKQSLCRGFIGIPIGLLFATILHSWIPLLCIATFYQQPPYGEKSYLNFLGEWGKWAVCGFIFGVSTTPVWVAFGLWWMGLIQGLISALAYCVIKYYDDRGKIVNPWTEITRGIFGTILLEIVWLMALLKLILKN